MPRLLRYLSILGCLLILGLAPAYAAVQPTGDDPLVRNAEDADPPDEYVFSAPYPNPFNPSTTFSLTVTQTQQVSVEVFNLLGQRVRVIYNDYMAADETHTFTFEAGDLHTGIYLIRVQAETFTATRQVTLLK